MSHSAAAQHLGPAAGRHPSTDGLFIEVYSSCSVCHLLCIIPNGKTTRSKCGQIVRFLCVYSNVLLGREMSDLITLTIVALLKVFLKVW